MKTRITYALFVILVLANNILNGNPIIQNGEANFTDINFSNRGLYPLNGEWLFYEGVFLGTQRNTNLDINIMPIEVPNEWSRFEMQKIKKGIGFGTYALLIKKKPQEELVLLLKDIGSAYKVWINKIPIFSCGEIGTDAAQSRPQFCQQNINLPKDTNQVLLWIEVSNFHQVRGGILQSPELLISRQIGLKQERDALYRYFCFGILFVIGLYHIGLWGLNRNDISSLLFGLFCLILLNFFTFRSRLVYRFYPDFSWELGNQIEYISQIISIPLFYVFFYHSFKRYFWRFFKVFAIAFSLLASIFVLLTPPLYFTHILTFIHVILLIYIPAVLIGLINSLKNKEPGARILLVGFSIFMVALINDILHVQNIIHTNNVIIFGVIGFILCQAYFLAYNSNQSRLKNIDLSNSLLELNNSLSRFIPQNFIDLMGKSNITEISLGNCTEQEMTIMFSDIRSFTTISEQLSSGESFRFINDYLQVMGPIIKSNNGFIDKYIGDGIMALFPNHPNDAVNASLEMMAALQKFNLLNIALNKPQIAIGIGLHYGTVVLGTVGEPDRMDTTVISDAVNLAARIESLTKQYLVSVIISGEAFDKLSNSLAGLCNFIGKATVKGKTIETKLYQVNYNEKAQNTEPSFSKLINEEVAY